MLPVRFAHVLSLLLLSLSCCARDTHDAPPNKPSAATRILPTQPSSVVSPTAIRSSGSARNLVMGTGEPRVPEPFSLEQRFLEAVRQADRATIERALEKGVRLDTKDDLGRSAVLLAVLDAGSLELVRWLHSKGAALDEPDIGGRTALSFAAAAGQLEIVRYLVQQGAVTDRGDVQRRTPLFHASLGDHRATVAFLLERGAHANARDQFGDTPLIVACAKGYGATAALLLEKGADPKLKDQEGRTASERAAPGTEACLNPTPSRP
jgi:hypothetical protein